jgi:hypothetical protein
MLFRGATVEIISISVRKQVHRRRVRRPMFPAERWLPLDYKPERQTNFFRKSRSAQPFSEQLQTI